MEQQYNDANSKIGTAVLAGHPIQPLIEDEQGVTRFKENAIVCYLLDNGGIDMNMIAMGGFSREDREQFAQLIGYSWSGACDLNYVSNEVLEAAREMQKDASEVDARTAFLRAKLADVRRLMLEGVAELFEIHPDDLKDNQ